MGKGLLIVFPYHVQKQLCPRGAAALSPRSLSKQEPDAARHRFAFVPDLAAIDWVGDYRMEMRHIKRFASELLARLRCTFACAKTEHISLIFHRSYGAKLQIQLKQFGDGLCFLRVNL